MWWTVVPTPIGDLGVGVDARGVRAVRFDGTVGASEPGAPPAEPAAVFDVAAAELGRYFAGELTDFSVPTGPAGGTPFEQAVWVQLEAVPYGETRTYGQIASAVGDPGAARAVGVACHRNPLPILVPCHRVVGAGNKLVGFGGGLPRKRHLLELEARVSFERAWA